MSKFDYLNDDLTFKQVFMKKEVLDDLITSFLDYIGKHDTNRLITELTPNAYLSPDNKKYKCFYGDLIANKNDMIISIEMYKDYFKEGDFNKSLGYSCRLYSRQEKRNKPSNYKKVISINFIKGNYKKENNNIVNGYSFKNLISNVEISDNMLIYLIRYDLISKVPIKVNEDRFIRYLRIIGSTSMKDIEKYGKGDKIMEETIKLLREWNIESSRENYIRRINEATEKGIEKGIKKGIEKGIATNSLNIAKRLINKNESKEYVIEVTGISEKDYERLVKKQ